MHSSLYKELLHEIRSAYCLVFPILLVLELACHESVIERLRFVPVLLYHMEGYELY